MGAIIMSYSKIGAGAVIAAGALVSERVEVAPGSVMVGVPAKERPRLDESQQRHLDQINMRYVEVSRIYKEELGEILGNPEGASKRGN
jgi:carbonic anhydrase/acetyltransferase-like protein (isoleucine patch superfamily)